VSILIEDTARNTLISWATDAHLLSPGVTGAILNPFVSPVRGTGYKPSAQTQVTRLRAAGLDVLFDPMTHVLQMPTVGDFRYYDEWPLWGAARGALESGAERDDHVRRIFTAQDTLDVPRLAPTILLHTPQSSTSQRALEMSEYACGLGPCLLSVVGDSAFWASDALDAHIGALAQLEPRGWHLAVARPSAQLPVLPDVGEVTGLARTTLALSEYAPVHISHGDLAALPALAAGATSVGTGWDPRQRVLAYPNFAARDPDAEGGSWFQRVTLGGLFGLLTQGDAALAHSQDPAAVARLLPGGSLPPGPKEAFLHHVAVLANYAAGRVDDPSVDAPALVAAYTAAGPDWAALASSTGLPDASSTCISDLSAALAQLVADEGW
jgi:hypothetical protein